MNMSDDEWYALPNKIDMIPNDETAQILRDRYMSIEDRRLNGMCEWDQSNNQRWLKNAVDSILSKYKDNVNNGDKQMNKEKFNELVNTINDNIDMLNYIVLPDGKLVLVCEFNENGKHFVKTWNNIQSHEDIIARRLGDK